MTDKIPQHSHCQNCGKAFIGEGRFCSEDCKVDKTAFIKKKKRQYTLLYTVALVMVLLVVLFLA